jgi:hypothetical protein
MNPLFLDRELPLFLVGSPVLLLGLAIPYAILKVRDARSEDSDSEIGLKSALYYGFSLGILLSLAGLTFLVYQLFEVSMPTNVAPPSTKMAQNTRVGLGLLASGIPTAVTHLVLILGMTNDRRYPDVRRIFVGWRLVIHGIVVLTAYTYFMVLLFFEDLANVDMSDLRLPMSVLLVWLPSWLIHLVLLRVYQRSVMPRLRMVPPTIPPREEEDG